MKKTNLSAVLAAGLALGACVSQDDYGSMLDGVDAFLLMTPAKPPAAQQYGDFLSARFAGLTNDPSAAALFYGRAFERDPGDGVLLERATFSALLAGDAEKAIELAKSAGPEELDAAPIARLSLAVDEFRNGDYDAARAQLDAGDLGPFNRIIARGVAAWADMALGDLDAAAARLTRSDGAAVLDGINLYNQALILSSLGRDQEAASRFEDAWRTGARLPIAVDAYARLRAASGDADAAAQIVESFRSDMGENPLVERTAEAIASEGGADAVRLTPAQGAAFSIYGPAAALAAQTNSDLAGLYFTLTLALDPDLDVARNHLSDALERGERYEEAFEVLDPVAADSVFFAASRAQQAWLLRRLERNDEALNVAAEALKEKPGRDLQMQLADLYRSVERYEEAEALFDEVVRADAAEGREDWRVMFARGAARERLERWPEAEADLLRALELSPNRPEVLNYLGYSWVDRGENIEEAFQLIKRAVDQRPDAGYIVDSLGWAYYRLGRYAEAVRYLEEAAELDPADPTINDHLGDAYWRVGRRDEARFQWARVLTLEAEAELVASVELKLDAGLDAPLVQTLAADTPPQVSDAQ